MKELIGHLAGGQSLGDSASSCIADSEFPGLAFALLALSAPDEALSTLASTSDLDAAGRLEQIALVSAESEHIDASVEDLLASERRIEVIEALARAGVAWSNPALAGALDDEHARIPAALLLSTTSPEDVREWLDACDVFEEAREVLRAVAMSGVVSLEDQIHEWRSRVDDFEQAEAEVGVLDGIMAVLDAEAYARQVLAGDADAGWLSSSPAVADFLQVYGPGEWLPVLGMLDICDDQAFEFGAFLSVCAAIGMGFVEPDEDEAKKLVELLSVEPGADAESWEPLATSLGLRFAIALATDDELALLAAQVGAHERLVSFGFHSPGIPGLPMSGTDPEALNFDASNAMLKQLLDGPSMPDAARVAVVRTLDDLYNHVVFGDGECRAHAQTWASRFSDSDVAAIALASRRLEAALKEDAARAEEAALADHATLDTAFVLAAADRTTLEVVEVLARAARSEKVLGLAAAQRLAVAGSLEALDELAQLWAQGPVLRAPFYRDAIMTGAHLRHESEGGH